MRNKFFALLFSLLIAGLLSAQEKDTIKSYIPKYNSFRFGTYYSMTGHKEERSFMYYTAYSRHLNRGIEGEFSVAFSNNINTFATGTGFPEETGELTSAVRMGLNLYISVLNLEKHFIKIGLGYSLNKVKKIEFKEMYVITSDDYYKSYASIKQDFINDYEGGLTVSLEYGFRITPNWALSVSGRYYEEDEHLGIVTTLGLNLYYSF